jgi:transcriptional regulator with XRE-family HTH domain
MQNVNDLKRVLSVNIKTARKNLGLTQEKLAAITGLSIPYMTDIERCRTWVSDTTLQKLANALHVKPYQLLVSDDGTENEEILVKNAKNETAAFISGEINTQKRAIKKFVEERMNDLLVQLAKGGQNQSE